MPLVRGARGELHATRLFRALLDGQGPESVVVLGGGGLTNERACALGKFARVVLRIPNIDDDGRGPHGRVAGGAGDRVDRQQPGQDDADVVGPSRSGPSR